MLLKLLEFTIRIFAERPFGTTHPKQNKTKPDRLMALKISQYLTQVARNGRILTLNFETVKINVSFSLACVSGKIYMYFYYYEIFVAGFWVVFRDKGLL